MKKKFTPLTTRQYKRLSYRERSKYWGELIKHFREDTTTKTLTKNKRAKSRNIECGQFKGLSARD